MPVDDAYLDRLLDTLEGQGSRLRHLEPRSSGRLERVGRGQDLLARCRALDTGCDVHTSAAEVTPIGRRFGCVQADTHVGREPMLAAMSRQPSLDVDRAL